MTVEVEMDDTGIGIKMVVTAISAEGDGCHHHQRWERIALVVIVLLTTVRVFDHR